LIGADWDPALGPISVTTSMSYGQFRRGPDSTPIYIGRLPWDQEFESGFLQRRVRKLSVPADQDLIDQSQKMAATARAEVVPNGKAVARAGELADLYLQAPEVTRRNTRIHFIQPLKERIVREVGYGLSLEGASSADLVKSKLRGTAEFDERRSDEVAPRA
jgi:hypothetical protein